MQIDSFLNLQNRPQNGWRWYKESQQKTYKNDLLLEICEQLLSYLGIIHLVRTQKFSKN